MKARFTSSALVMFLLFAGPRYLKAQNNTGCGEAAPETVILEGKNQGYPETPPLWLLQFSHNSENASGSGGQAGIVFTKGEFWASFWNADSIIRLDKNGNYLGSFKIPGVANIRGMTFDGTKVYAVNNSNLIYMIDTLSKTSLGTITAPMAQVRHVTYDPTANSNAGGFWVGNWNTSLVQISLTGTTLNTIAAGTHNLTGMYGSAYDNMSPGGPYLWIFDQNTSASNSDIVRLQLPAGTQTGMKFDVVSDPQLAGLLSSGLAGGLYAANNIVAGKKTLVALIQGTPDNLIIGYELGNQATVDGSMVSAHTVQGYTQIPLKHLVAETLQATVRNQGLNTISTVTVDFTVRQGGSTVFTGSGTGTNIATNTEDTIPSSTTWTPPGVGTYTISSLLTTSLDSIPGNDSSVYTLMITDSTYARDDGNPLGGLGYAASNTSWAYTGALWDMVVPDTLTSVWISIQSPVLGDTTYAVIASVSNGQPLNLVAVGNPVIIDDNQEDYTLTLNGDLPIPAGPVFIGVYEVEDTTINLKHSSKVYVDGMNWLFFPASGWVASSIKSARFIRPNFGNVGTLVERESASGRSGVYVAPNPSRGIFTVGLWEATNVPVVVIARDVSGRTVRSFTAPDSGTKEIQIDLSDQPIGTYFLEISGSSGMTVSKVMIMQ